MSKLFEAIDKLDSFTLNEGETILYAIANEDGKAFHLGWKEGVFDTREAAEKMLAKEYADDNYQVVEMPEDYFLAHSMDAKKYLKQKSTDSDEDSESSEDPVAFDKEAELERLHSDDIYYEIAEFLHIDKDEADFGDTLNNMKNRLDELELEPEKYLELLKQYQADGKNVNDVLDDYEFGDIE